MLKISLLLLTLSLTVTIHANQESFDDCIAAHKQYNPDAESKNQNYDVSDWINPITNDRIPCAQQQFHWNSFGNEFFPIAFVKLPYFERNDKTTLASTPQELRRQMKDGKFTDLKFEDRWEKWGFTVDPNIHPKLAIGLARIDTVDEKRAAGFNCAACHTAKFTYDGKSFYVNGAPARADFTNFVRDMYASFHFNLFDYPTGRSLSLLKLDARLLERQLFKKYSEQLQLSIQRDGMNPTLESIEQLIQGNSELQSLKVQIKVASKKRQDYPFAKIRDEFIQDAIPQQAESATGLKAAAAWGVKNIVPFFGRQAFEDINSTQMDPSLLTQFPVELGPGRTDAFNLGLNLLLRKYLSDQETKNEVPMAIPSLWNIGKFDMAQWNAGISGAMYRNIIAAVAIRTPVDLNPGPDQFKTSARLKELNKQEQIIASIKPPEWPEHILGEIDMDLRDKGEKIYHQTCKGCHEPEVVDVNGREMWVLKKMDPFQLGVDTTFVESYGQRRIDLTPLLPEGTTSLTLNEIGFEKLDGWDENGNYVKSNSEQSGNDSTPTNYVEIENFVVRHKPSEVEVDPSNMTLFNTLNFVMNSVLDRAFKEQNISAQEKEQMRAGFYPTQYGEKSAFFAGNAPRIKAVPLHGIWASAPYLHNNTVLTLMDLLTDENERPTDIAIGTTEYDPINVGMKKGGMPIDVSLRGNSNKGHSGPEYGTELSDADKRALLEYLKWYR